MKQISVLSTIIAIAITTTFALSASAKEDTKTKATEAHRDDTSVKYNDSAPDSTQRKDRTPPATSSKSDSVHGSVNGNCTTAKCKYGSLDDGDVSINNDAVVGTNQPAPIALNK